MDSDQKVIAFDVYGTLLETETEEDSLAMQLLIKRLKKRGHYIIVWTANGEYEAVEAVKMLGLVDHVDECRSKLADGVIPDISFDDTPGALSKEASIWV